MREERNTHLDRIVVKKHRRKEEDKRPLGHEAEWSSLRAGSADRGWTCWSETSETGCVLCLKGNSSSPRTQGSQWFDSTKRWQTREQEMTVDPMTHFTSNLFFIQCSEHLCDVQPEWYLVSLNGEIIFPEKSWKMRKDLRIGFRTQNKPLLKILMKKITYLFRRRVYSTLFLGDGMLYNGANM